MTAQIADSIAVDGQQQMLFSEPLEVYYSRQEMRPPFIPDSTANWRGYVASWEIQDGRLLLTGIQAQICEDPAPAGWTCRQRRAARLQDLFPDRTPPVFADWYSGTLRVPLGAQINYVHMGYESVYEFDLLLTVEKGRVVSTTTVDNRHRRAP